MTTSPVSLDISELENLLEAGRSLASLLDCGRLFKAVTETVSRLADAEAGSILLVDDHTGELFFDTAYGSVSDKIKSFRLKPGEGVAGWVAQEKRPLLVNDVLSDPRWASRVDKGSSFVTRQLLAVPVMFQGRLLGVLEAINKKNGDVFTPRDLRVMELLATQVGVAVDNALLFERLRSEKDTLETLVGEMSDGALLCDAMGLVSLVNNVGGRLLGVSEEEALGQFLPEITRTFIPSQTWKQVLESKTPVLLELVREVGKKLVLAGTFQPLQEGRGRLFVFRDVTDVRREEKLKRNFLAVISHKLKTPLVSITGFAPLLLEDPSLSPSQRKGLTAIRDQGEKLTHLVEKLLEFTTVESESVAINRRSILVKPALEQASARLAESLTRRGVQIEMDESLDALPSLFVDPIRFEEVYRNLIENAAKFNRGSSGLIRLYGRLEHGTVHLSVEDDGPGIPPEELTRIFDKFHQVEDSFTGQVDGAGLGLALSKRIVEAHGGTLAVHSVLGKGSVFTASWPYDEYEG